MLNRVRGWWVVAFGIVAMLVSPRGARGDADQVWLAAQHDWAAHRGYFLVVTSEGAKHDPAQISDAKVLLGVGDGKSFHYLTAAKPWDFGRKYVAKAVIEKLGAELWLDGVEVGKEAVNFEPGPAQVQVGAQPSFLRGAAEYDVRVSACSAIADGRKGDFALGNTTLPAQLRMLSGSGGAISDLPFDGKLTIEVTFSFERRADARALSPFIDKYGQAIAAEFPGKITSDEDLKAPDAQEDQKLKEMGEPGDRDAYGGTTLIAAEPHTATGFFHVVNRHGMWWLVTPAGHPCFYIGLDDAPDPIDEGTPVTGRAYLFDWLPPTGGEFAPAWATNQWHLPGEANENYLAFSTVNLIRKFGTADFEKRVEEQALRRAKALGFSGYGKWTPAEGAAGACTVAVLEHADVPNIAGHPDVFDAEIRRQFVESLRKQMQRRLGDPYLLGWSVGNEKDEDIDPSEITTILTLPDNVWAKRALVRFAQQSIYKGKLDRWRKAWKVSKSATRDQALTAPPDDLEKLREFYEEKYYAFIFDTVKSIDPNHLYLGMWVTPNWWVNESDWRLIGKYCDVIGYDFYALKFDAAPMDRLLSLARKPVICGEFSFPPTYDGERGFGRYPVNSKDDVQTGDLYAQWVSDAARNPWCVGVMWFKYRDEPITGRGPVNGASGVVLGEDYAFGLVDVGDRVRWKLAERMRQANAGAMQERLSVSVER